MYEVAPEGPRTPRPQTALTPSTTPGRQPVWRMCVAWVLVALVGTAAIYYGVKLRRWAWDVSTDIRFENSVSNAIEWGRYANEVGVLNVYDKLVERFGLEGDYGGPARFALDYPPLRLMIAGWWADWAQHEFPPHRGQTLVWRPEYEFTKPMLRLNLACELLATAGMFLLVYRWVRVCRGAPAEKWWRLRDHALPLTDLPPTVGLWTATLAALLLWFNPAVIFNAHVYPQWDVWLLPAFIFGAYFVIRGWWLAAGFAIGMGAMAKGQVLFAAPLLLALPLLRGQITGVLRMLIGMGAAVGLIVWPWMLRDAQAQRWMIWVGVATIPLVLVNLLPRRRWAWITIRITLLLAAVGIMTWFALPMSWDNRMWVGSLIGLVAVCAMLGSRWWAMTCAAAMWVGCLALTVPLYNASMAWYEVGIKYGTRHWRQLFWCHACNLGSILQLRFQWQYASTVDLSWIPWLGLTEPVSLRAVMITANAVLLGVVVVAALRHRVKHDPKLLLALAVPLMLAYTILPQMIERYLLWPAALLSAYAAVSLSGLLLWLVLSLMACAMMLEYMLSMVRRTHEAQQWLPYLQVIYPDTGWAVMVLAGVMLFMVCAPTIRRKNELPLASGQV